MFRSLYRHVVDMARRDADVIGIRLYVERDNVAAQRTYRDLGMEALAYLMMEQSPL